MVSRFLVVVGVSTRKPREDTRPIYVRLTFPQLSRCGGIPATASYTDACRRGLLDPMLGWLDGSLLSGAIKSRLCAISKISSYSRYIIAVLTIGMSRVNKGGIWVQDALGLADQRQISLFLLHLLSRLPKASHSGMDMMHEFPSSQSVIRYHRSTNAAAHRNQYPPPLYPTSAHHKIRWQ